MNKAVIGGWLLALGAVSGCAKDDGVHQADVDAVQAQLDDMTSERDSARDALEQAEGHAQDLEGQIDDAQAAAQQAAADAEAALADREAAVTAREQAVSAAEARQHANTFSDGIFQVGQDIEPGTYHTDGSFGSCYYAKLGPDGQDILDNNITEGPATVQVDSPFFESNGCGTWTKVG